MNVGNENRVKLLDCTLRDGGNALEDAHELSGSQIVFNDEIIDNTIQYLKEAQIDIIELGVAESDSEDRHGFSYYPSIESISKKIPNDHSKKQMYVAGFNIPDSMGKEIPDWKPGLCEGVRVYLRYSDLKRSLKFCDILAQKGYKVFMQNALTMRYSEKDIDLVISAANNLGAFAVYFVDTYGYMEEKDIDRFIHTFDNELNSEIRIGFHAHNNLNLAFSNVKHLLSKNISHDLVIDSCVMGMGRSAGNLQTELIVPYLKRNYNKQYNYGAVLEAYEYISQFQKENIWGYSALTLLAALHKTSNKYTSILRNQYHFSYKEINEILCFLSPEMRYRYTKEYEFELITAYKKAYKGKNKVSCKLY